MLQSLNSACLCQQNTEQTVKMRKRVINEIRRTVVSLILFALKFGSFFVASYLFKPSHAGSRVAHIQLICIAGT